MATHVKELTPEEFQSTIAVEMRGLDESDNTCADVQIVEYVERCIGGLQMQLDVDDLEWHYSYMNDEKQLCHVGLNFGDEHLYLVVVVDVAHKKVMGHCVLDFSKSQV